MKAKKNDNVRERMKIRWKKRKGDKDKIRKSIYWQLSLSYRCTE